MDAAVVCDLLALALSSGAGVDAALRAVAGEGGEGAGAREASEDEATIALRSLAAGRRWGLAGEGLAAMLPPSWDPVVRALTLADAAGVPPSGALRRAAEDIRTERRHRLEVATAQLRVRVVLPLGLCFLPAFVLTTVVPVVLALASRVVAP